MALVVNGRFLKRRATGLHRVGRGLIDALRGSGVELDVVAPVGTDDPRVDRTTPAPPAAADILWEQVVLPFAARGRPILSLANTAPLATPRGALMVHDLAPLVGPEWFGRRGRAYGRLTLAAARRSRCVVAPSRAVLDELAARGIPADRLSVVRPALPEGFGAATRDAVDAVRARYGLDRAYLLHVGWGDPRKDVATAVSAHLRVASRVPHDLVLVGSSHPNLAPVRLPSADTIRRLGYVDDDELRALLTGATAFLFPSRYEGFGLPPLEAMACGTPAIVSDLPVLRESTGGDACFVPPGDVGAWAEALTRGLAGELETRTPVAWTWADAGSALVDALRSVRLL